MTDKPTTQLLPIAVTIYQTSGEDAARLWYDSLSEEQQAMLQTELATFTRAITNSFKSVADIYQKRLDAISLAFRPLAEALAGIDRNKINRV